MFWQKQIAQLTDRIHQSEQDIQAAQQRGMELFRHGLLNTNRYPQYFGQLLATNDQDLQSLFHQQNLPAISPWHDPRWNAWTLSGTEPPASLDYASWIRIGDEIEQRSINGNQPLVVPRLIPFIGRNKTIILRCDAASRELGLALLQSLVIRTALLLSHQIRYTLCDPANNGGAFLMRRSLPEGLVRENSGELYRDLLEVSQNIRTIKESYLDPSAPTLHELKPAIRVNERFEGIFAADFPKRYDRRDIEELQKIGNSGPDAGKYLFIHYNTDLPLPRDIAIEDFENAYIVDLVQSSPLQTSCHLKFHPDPCPEPTQQTQLLNIVRAAKPPERKLNWDEVVGNCATLWSETTESQIKTPIGGRGSTDTLDIWFGKDSEGRQCAHGMLGAMTGSGKSNLYHVMILGLAMRYSPAELRFYLIDGKEGVELKPYQALPHTEVVSLHSSPQLSRSVLTELIAEKERRNTLFKQADVNDFSSYRAKVGAKLHRILLVVDEYQELFIGDQEGVASNQLLILAQQGRSTGIHLLLASQRFGAAGMLRQTEVFGNIHLRMGMKMSSADIQALTEFGRRGKQLLATCDLPGKIVINDASGDDHANAVGKVAFLSPERRDQVIQALQQRAQSMPSLTVPDTIVFDGDQPPTLLDNPQLNYLLHQEQWLSDTAWETLARQPLPQHGLELSDWFAAEYPAVLWLGQEFSVRQQAKLILRRRSLENVLVVGGDNHTARYGMLAAMLTSLAVGVHPQKLQFHLLDRSIPGTQWHPTLEQLSRTLLHPAGFQVSFQREPRQLEPLLTHFETLLKQRQQMSEAELINQASIVVVLTELDRIDNIRRPADSFYGEESELGQKLKVLYQEGATKGIHLILSFAGVNAMTKVIDSKRGLPHFRHRIALQMSEDDAFTYGRDRQASRLQQEGAIPVRALYRDMESDRSTVFKPYSTDSEPPLIDYMQTLGQQLSQWGQRP